MKLVVKIAFGILCFGIGAALEGTTLDYVARGDP